jgi:hypothetical protein
LKAGVKRAAAPSTGSKCTRDVGVMECESPLRGVRKRARFRMAARRLSMAEWLTMRGVARAIS